MMMVDLTRKPANEDAVLRIYNNELRLNKRAAALLKLDAEHAKIRFTYDRDERDRGRGMRVYVSKERNDSPRGYMTQSRNKSVRIYSTSLCNALSEALDGRGAYRICPEVSMSVEGVIYYEVFFRKYE